MTDLILELRFEALPGQRLRGLAERLAEATAERLREAGVPARQSALGYTCRRVSALLRGLPSRSEVDAKQVAGALERAVSDFFSFVAARQAGESDVAAATGLMAVWDGAAVEFEHGGLAAGDATIGHPVLSPATFVVGGLHDYARSLLERGIEVRPRERARRLLEQVEERVGPASIVIDDALLERWVASCEIPGLLVLDVEAAVEDLPPELLSRVLRARLGALALSPDGSQGALRVALPIDRADGEDGRIAEGYERAVLRCLRDVCALWHEDRGTPLSARVGLLESFPAASGGTLAERRRRVRRLAPALARELGWESEVDAVREAATLLFVDRTTRLVARMPELGGTLGGLLAREEGYGERVWRAVSEARLPIEGGRLPRGRVGKLVAAAERLDRLVALETSERRVEVASPLRDLTELALRGDLDIDLELALAQVDRARARESPGGSPLSVERIRQLAERWSREAFVSRGFQEDEVTAVLSSSASARLGRRHQRLRALRRLRQEPLFPPLVRTASRVAEIVRGRPEETLDPDLLRDERERKLYEGLQAARRPEVRLEGDDARGPWLAAMSRVAAETERFVDEVLVHDESATASSGLALLQAVDRLFSREIRLGSLHVGGAGSV